LIAGASVVDAAYFAHFYGRDFAPRLVSWFPVASPMLCLAALLSFASGRAGTVVDRLGLRVAWGLLGAYALFVAALLLVRPGFGWMDLALAKGSLAVCACAVVCAIAIFLARGRSARAADPNRGAIHDWANRS
jgi:hypothetical protein